MDISLRFAMMSEVMEQERVFGVVYRPPPKLITA